MSPPARARPVTGPDGFSRAGSSSTLDFVPVEAGIYPVTVTVTDSSGQSATASTDITVTHVQPVAVISSGPGTHIDPVAGVATIQILANVPDPGSDGDNFQYSWLVTDDTRRGAMVAQQSPGATNSPSLTFSGPSADNYTLTLRVTDDDGGEATVVVPIRIGVTSTVTLTNANVPANTAMVLGVAYNGTVIDASGLSVPFTGVALGSHDTLIGGAGPNVLQGDSGFNMLEGGTGSNTMYATGGDTLVGGGGTGTDLFALIPRPADAPDAPISLQPDATRQSTLSFAQSATGISFNATLIGGQEQALATGDLLELFGAVQQAVGSAGNDSLVAGNGSTLFGGGGNDTLVASGGSDIALVAGSQADLLAAQGSADLTLFGTSGSNSVVTSETGTPITLFGGSGQSLLISNNSNNVTLLGGSGTTTRWLASGGTNVTLFGGSGNAMLTSTNGNNVSMLGGNGNDTLTVSAGTNITLFGGTGNDSLQATGGSDLVLVGGSGNSQLDVSGSTGATLFGGSGSNTLTSTSSNNVSMIGGSGDATLTASGGTGVTLFGGDGSDSLTSGNVASLLMTGGAGRDTLTSANDTDAVLMSGGLSNDRLAVTDGTRVAVMGGGGDDTLSAAGGTGISLSGLDGNNLYQLTGTPADPLDVALNDLGTFGSSIVSTDGTSDGINTITFPGVTSGITLDLSNVSLGPAPGPQQQQQVAPGLTLSLTGFFQNVIGTAGANWIKGDPAANVLQGQGGNDTLIGGSGPATLVAGSGSDVLMGGPGGTTYRFAGTGLGNVTVEPTSDTSNDTLDFSQVGGAVTLDLTSAAAQPVSPAAGLTLTITRPLGITGVVDTAFNDNITGNARDDVFTVQGGNDTFTGGGGNDTYNFSAASRGSKILNETPAMNSALDFHAFDGPVNMDLTQSGPQVVSPGNLTLTLTPPTAFDRVIGSRFPDTIRGNDRGDTLIGGGGADLITSGSGADFIQGGITQVVYLDFDAGSQPGYHVYTQAERDAIQTRLEAIYKNFSFVFTQDPAQAAQLAQVTGGQFATLNFNVGPYPGASHELDTENLDLGGSATINVNPALGSEPDLVPDTSADVVGLTATIAAHELGHLVGLEHGDAFGPIDTGIYAGVDPDEFRPVAYPGPDDAVDTPSDVMASPESVHSPLIDAAGATQFGERDALHLAFNDNGTLLRAQDLTGLIQPVNGLSFSVPGGGVDQVTSAVVLGDLPQLAVPNTLLDPSSGGYGRTFQTAALGVLGTIATPGQEDFYAITRHAGEVMSFEVASEEDSLNPRPFPPELIVVDGAGHVLGYNVLNFESGDPMILDVTLPADGTYYVGVDAYGGQAIGDYRLLMYSLSAVSGGAPQGNGITVYGSGGNDTLVGSSGDDTFIYQAGSVGQVTIQASSGADVLDLRRAPLVTYTLTGDPALGTLTVLTQSLSVVSTQTVSALQGITTGSVLLATFTQGSATQSASAYTVTVAWGDGTSDTSGVPHEKWARG